MHHPQNQRAATDRCKRAVATVLLVNIIIHKGTYQIGVLQQTHQRNFALKGEEAECFFARTIRRANMQRFDGHCGACIDARRKPNLATAIRVK